MMIKELSELMIFKKTFKLSYGKKKTFLSENYLGSLFFSIIFE